MIPSSDQIASDSRSSSSRIRARQREPPGGVDAAAERAEDAQPPVADLVAEALDHDRLIGRDHARRLLLLGEELDAGSWRRADRGRTRAWSCSGVSVDRRPGERADRLTELARAPDAVALPERDRAREAGRRRDDHPVAADLLDPPGRRAEQERLARAGLVDHLLVELADAPAVGQRHRVQAAVGDRPGVRHRELAGARAGLDRPRDPVPDDPRSQLGELGRRVAAVEHVEHVLELLAAELGVAVRAGDERVEVVDGDRLILGCRGGDRDDLLGEHVERVARDDRRLDLAVAHPLGDDRALEQVGAELGEDPPAADVADGVPGAADPLQSARDRLRRLDLDDEVDGAHVDAELEARGRDQARELAGLQHLLDDEPLLAREAPWWARAISFSARSLSRSASRSARAAAVDEQDRRAVRLDQLRAARGRSRARSSGGSPRRRRAGRARVIPAHAVIRLDHRLDRDVDPEVELLAHAGVDDPAGPLGPTMNRPTSSSGFCVALRPIRWTSRPAAALRRSSVSARCAPRFVEATAWISSTMHHCVPANSSCARPVSIRYSDSGVVIRMSGGSRSIAWRSFCGVSPVRTATVISAPIPRSGTRRLRSMS